MARHPQHLTPAVSPLAPDGDGDGRDTGGGNARLEMSDELLRTAEDVFDRADGLVAEARRLVAEARRLREKLRAERAHD